MTSEVMLRIPIADALDWDTEKLVNRFGVAARKEGGDLADDGEEDGAFMSFPFEGLSVNQVGFIARKVLGKKPEYLGSISKGENAVEVLTRLGPWLRQLNSFMPAYDRAMRDICAGIARPSDWPYRRLLFLLSAGSLPFNYELVEDGDVLANVFVPMKDLREVEEAKLSKDEVHAIAQRHVNLILESVANWLKK